MSDATDLTYAGVAVQAERLAAREVAARELVCLASERIDATQDTIGAFRVVRHEAARAAGERLPLLGVPVAIKDDRDLAGETTPRRAARARHLPIGGKRPQALQPPTARPRPGLAGRAGPGRATGSRQRLIAAASAHRLRSSSRGHTRPGQAERPADRVARDPRPAAAGGR
jgi:hypothetical protein